MSFTGESIVFWAFAIGIFSAVSLPLGAATSFLWRPDQRVIAALMAFGAGSLLAALSIDLVGSALEHGHFNTLAIGSIIGGLLFIGLNSVVNNYGGYKRKFSTALHHRHLLNKQRLKNTLHHIGRIELFEGIEDKDIEFLSQSIESRFYAKGAKIFMAGEVADELYIVQEGLVELLDRSNGNEQNEIVEKNSAFGRLALYTGAPHFFTAIAKENSFISVIPKESLEGLSLVCDRYKKHVLNWLLSSDIEDYLKNKQKIPLDEISKWQKEVEQNFSQECILPDISQIKRNKNDFLNIAPNIKRISWLEDLSPQEAQDLSQFLTYKTYKEGEVIFAQGEPAQYLFIIHEGEVILRDENSKNRFHKQSKNDGVGALAFFCGLKHMTNAIASSDVGVWTLKRNDLGKLLLKNMDFRLRMQFFLQSEELVSYLEQKYRLNQGKIISWVRAEADSIKLAKPPMALLEAGIESTNPHGASLAIWLGIMLDGIPESLVIGATMIHGSISASLVAGLFLSNYPEALSSSRGMRDEGLSRWKVIVMWSSIMLFTGIGAALGNIFMQSAPAHWFALLEGLAAGAMLTMIAQTMLPEAYNKGGSITGFSTLMGFLLTISLKGLDG